MCVRFVLVALLLLLPASSWASDALKSLERIEYRCRSGVYQGEYISLVRDAEFELDRAGVKSGPLRRALGHYQYGVRLWAWKASLSPGVTPATFTGEVFFRDYPGTKKPISEGGVLHDINPGGLSINAAIEHVWKKASQELKKARR